MKISKLSLVIFIIITVLSFVVRLWRIDAPVADWHSWRQADTAAVARNFVKFGPDPLHPRYDDLSNIQSGKDNPNGWRMVEFPLYQFKGAMLFYLFSFWSVEIWLRIISIVCTMVTGITVGLLVSKYINPKTGLMAYAIYSFMPYGIYYGRSILPEPMAVMFAVLSIYLLDIYFERSRRNQTFTTRALFIFSALSAALALLVKPTTGFLLVPSAYLFLTRLRISWVLVIQGVIYGSVVLFPFWWWRSWISQYPEGIPSYLWLFNNAGIRFKGAWFYWLFAERLSKLILGYWGIFPFLLGLTVRTDKRESGFFYPWIVGIVLYITIVASGNVQHDYYQILALPVISIYVAKGFAKLSDAAYSTRITSLLVGSVVFIFMIAMSWYTVRTYYWINRPDIVTAGRTADRMIPADAKVIAPYNGDTTFLYQINRQGWPIGFDIDNKISNGADYYVTVSPTDLDFETKELADKYKVLVRNDKFAIIDLRKPRSGL